MAPGRGELDRRSPPRTSGGVGAAGRDAGRGLGPVRRTLKHAAVRFRTTLGQGSVWSATAGRVVTAGRTVVAVPAALGRRVRVELEKLGGDVTGATTADDLVLAVTAGGVDAVVIGASSGVDTTVQLISAVRATGTSARIVVVGVQGARLTVRQV